MTVYHNGLVFAKNVQCQPWHTRLPSKFIVTKISYILENDIKIDLSFADEYNRQTIYHNIVPENRNGSSEICYNNERYLWSIYRCIGSRLGTSEIPFIKSGLNTTTVCLLKSLTKEPLILLLKYLNSINEAYDPGLLYHETVIYFPHNYVIKGINRFNDIIIVS